MSEILFRGKRTDNGKWVEGYLMRPDPNACVAYELFDCAIGYQVSYTVGFMFHPVIPATVGQYTGLTDKTGKKIFEGDVVQMRTSGLSGRGEIVFKDGAFVIDDKKRKRFYYMYHDAVYRVEGNIHDNPELMEDK